MALRQSLRWRRETPVPALARWLLGLGIAVTLAANVAHGLGHGPIGAAVAAWPAIALVGSYELLMMVIRSSQAEFDDMSDSRPSAGWPIPFLTGHRADRPRRGGAVLLLHCLRVTRESLEVRGGSGHD